MRRVRDPIRDRSAMTNHSLPSLNPARQALEGHPGWRKESAAVGGVQESTAAGGVGGLQNLSEHLEGYFRIFSTGVFLFLFLPLSLPALSLRTLSV